MSTSRALLGFLVLTFALWAPDGASTPLRDFDDVEELDPAAAKRAGVQKVTVQNLPDHGNVSVIEVDGDYSRGVAESRFEIARNFYESHADEFDFLVAFTTFEFETGDAVAFYNPVKNDVSGIGVDSFDHSVHYGSGGKLQGYIDMAALRRYDFNSRAAGFRQPLNMLAHEIMHRWAVRARYVDAQGATQSNLLGHESAHWSLLASSDASIMYGATWQAEGDGHFRIVEARQRLGWWDLYLAGLASPAEIAPLTLIRSAATDANDLPEVGRRVSGVAESIDISQLVAAEGPRVPSATEAPRAFNAAMLLLTRPEQAIDPVDLARLERFRVAFENYFQAITRGRATISLHLARAIPVAGNPAALDASPVSPPPAPIVSALQWLHSRQFEDGHWEDRSSTAIRDTAAAVATLEAVETDSVPAVRARQWLSTASVRNADEASWLTESSPDVPGTADTLNIDGGIGLLPRWTSSPVDSARVLSARRVLVQRNESELQALANYVASRQNPDGSFAPTTGGAGRIIQSAVVADLLRSREDAASQSAANRAGDWLATRLQAEWLESVSTPVTELAELLQRSGSLQLPEALRSSLVQELLERQGSAGDWGGSVYATARAVSALSRAAQPNLVPIGISVEPSTAVRGEPVRLRVRVGNRGGQAAAATTLAWYAEAVQGTPLTTAAVRPLLSGDEVSVDAWLDTDPLQGAIDLRVVVDAANQVEESREEDNQLSHRLLVEARPEGIDLALIDRDLTLLPSSLERVPSTVRLSGQVRNLGTVASGQLVVRAEQIRSTGTFALGETTMVVAAGAQEPFTIDLAIQRAESHRVRVTVDADAAVAEVREDNNRAEVTLPLADSLDLELIPSSLQFDAAPRIGEDTRVEFRIANRGTRDSALTSVRLEHFRDGTWNALADAALAPRGGEEVERALTWRPSTAATHALRVRVDPDAIVAEGDEDNNQIEFAAIPVADDAPALSVVPGSLVVSPQPLLQGAPFEVSARIRNSSAVDAPAFDVALHRGDPRNGGVLLGSARVADGLAASAEIPLTLSIDDYAEHGDAALYVQADAGLEVAERDELDNFGLVEVEASKLADLTTSAGALLMTPSSPVGGQAVRLEVGIANVGEQPSAAASVQLFEIVDGTPVEVSPSMVLSALAPGAERTLSWEWPLHGNAQAVRVAIDPENVVREFDEANNDATRVLQLQSGEAFASETWFSPNGDGVKDETQAVFADAAGIASAVVHDRSGRLRRRLVLEQVVGGAVQSSWDGRTDDGSVVEDGSFTIVAFSAEGVERHRLAVFVDNDREAALAAVDTADGVLRELPDVDGTWAVGVEGAASDDHAYAVSNGLQGGSLVRSVVRSHLLFGGIETLVGQAWLARYSLQHGMLGLVPTDVWPLADGRLLVAMNELGGGNRTLLFVQGAADVDRPRLLVALTRSSLRLVGEPNQGEVVFKRDTGKALIVDLATGSIVEIDLDAVLDRSHSASAVQAALPAGLLMTASGASIVPYDPQQPPRVLGGESQNFPRKAKALPGTNLVLLHYRGGFCTGERVTLVDAASGEERELFATGEPGCPEEPIDAEDTSNADLRAFWLERERVAVVVDHVGRKVMRFDVAGRVLASAEWVETRREGPYAPDGESPVYGNPGEVPNETCDCDSASRWSLLEWSDRLIDNQSRVFDPVSSAIHVWLGETVRRKYGAVDFLRWDADGLRRVGGLSELPLLDETDQQNYPFESEAAPPADWPQLIQQDGTVLRQDGRVFSPATGRMSRPWDFASRILAVSTGGGRLWLRGDGTSLSFGTLKRLTSALQASSDGSAVRLSGIAADRHLDHYRVDWASVAASETWHALIPPTAGSIRFDEFISWAPPAPGAYRFRLRVVDRAGNRRDSFATAEVARGAPIANLRQGQRAISPNGDGVQDALRLDFTVLRDNSQQIDVVDEAGRRVRRVDVVFGSGDVGARHWTWDGRGDGGQVVADGKYRVEFSSGHAVRVDVDVVAPRIEARLIRLDGDLFDELDLQKATEPLTGLGPMIEHAVDERFAGERDEPRIATIQSSPLAEGDWMDIEAYRTLEFGSGPVQSLLYARDYAERRFRYVAEDRAGNRSEVVLGASDSPLLMLGADVLYRGLPTMQTPPRGRLDGIPTYYADNVLPLDSRSFSYVMPSPSLPLLALDLRPGLEAISVDELRTSPLGVREWAQLTTGAPAVVANWRGGWLPALGDRLTAVNVDLSGRSIRERVSLRMRGRYGDGSEVSSNALEFVVGGVELDCGFILEDDTQFGRQGFLASLFLPPPKEPDQAIEVSHRERGMPCSESSCPVAARYPLSTFADPDLQPQFLVPHVEELRRELNVWSGRELLYRVSVSHAYLGEVRSLWKTCKLSASSELNVQPVLVRTCGSLSPQRVLLTASLGDGPDLQFRARLVHKATGNESFVDFDSGEVYRGSVRREISTEHMAQGSYTAHVERRVDSSADWRIDSSYAPFVVDHDPPVLRLVDPPSGERTCANDFDGSVRASLEDDRRVGWRIRSAGRVEGCDGLVPGDPEHTCETSPVVTGSIDDFSAAAPLFAQAHLPVDDIGDNVEVEVEAWDWSGAKVCAVSHVDIDGEVEFGRRAPPLPRLPSVIEDLVGISPGSSTGFAKARWSLRAGESIDLDVKLYAAVPSDLYPHAYVDGSPIATLRAASAALGEVDFEWDGRVDGQPVADGLYAARFTAVDECGNWRVLDEFIQVDATPPDLALLSPADGSTLPSVSVPIVGTAEDPYFALAEFSVSTQGPAGPWVTIGESTRAATAPEVLALWEPRGVTGPAWVRIAANDALGNTSTLIRAFSLVAVSDLLQSASVAPTLISPNDDGRRDLATVRIEVARNARIALRVLDATLSEQRVLAAGLEVPVGPQSINWDGTDSAGQPVADGLYAIEVRVAEAGTEAFGLPTLLHVAVDRTSPVFDEIVPDAEYDCSMAATFTVADDRLDQWDARLSQQGEVLQSAEGRLAGRQSLSLDAREDGSYVLELVASDAAENRSEFARSFVRDCTPPIAELATQDLRVRGGGGAAYEIRGVASDTNLERFRLELADSMGELVDVIHEASTPLADGLLARWTPTLEDGRYWLRLVVVDRAGNESTTGLSVTVDGTPPTARIDAPTTGSSVGRTLELHGVATDEQFSHYRIELATAAQAAADRWTTMHESDTPSDGGLLGTLELPYDGEFELRLVVEDEVGLTAVARVGVIADLAPPSAPQLSGVLDQHAVRLDWQVAEDEGVVDVAIYRNDVHLAEVASPARRYVDADAPDGSNRYHVIARDQVGNLGPSSNEVVLQVDRTAPRLVLRTPLPAQRVRSIVDIVGSVETTSGDLEQWSLTRAASGTEEPLRHSTVEVSNGLLFAWDTRSIADESQVTLHLRAVDRVGNAASIEVPLVVDNLPPAAPTGLNAASLPEAVTLSWSPNIEADLLGYLVYRGGVLLGALGAQPEDLRALAIAENELDDSEVPDGEISYTVYAIDLAGNISEPSTPVSLTRDTHAPRMRLLQPSAGLLFQQPIAILAESSDRDIANVAFAYRAVGASSWTTIGTATTRPWRATFDPATLAFGRYELRALATDAGGRIDPAPPSVDVRYADLTPPPAPTAVDARSDGERVSVAWTASPAEDVRGYRVERSSNAGTWTQIGEVGATTTAIVDVGLVPGRYEYRVLALDDANESDPSAIDIARVFEIELEQPMTPVALDRMTLRGRSATEAGQVHYVVGHLTGDVEGSGPPVVVGERFELEGVTLREGANDIAVSVATADGDRSIRSHVRVVRGLRPLPPGNLDGVVTGHLVTLGWQPSPSADVVGYRIYRNGQLLGEDSQIDLPLQTRVQGISQPRLVDGDVQTGVSFPGGGASARLVEPVRVELQWTHVRLVGSLELHFAAESTSASAFRVLAQDDAGVWVPLAERSERSATVEWLRFVDAYPTRALRIELTHAQAPGATISLQEIEVLARSVVVGTTHEEMVSDGRHAYEATAISGLGFESDRSSAWTAEIGDAEAPEPVILSGLLDGSDAELSWTPSDSADVGGYGVYRDGARIASVDSSTRSFVDTALGNGIYRYVVVAEDANFNASAPSNSVEIVVDAEPPGRPEIASVDQPPGVNGLRISWIAGGGAAAVRYRLYASSAEADPTRPYELLLTTTQPQYLHQDLTPGEYWYRVQALDARGNASVWSAPVRGTVLDQRPPVMPVISHPTVAGVPLEWNLPRFEVCGTTSPDADVIIVRNGEPVAEAAAADVGAPRALDFARGPEVVLSATSSTILSGAAGASANGWYEFDGTFRDDWPYSDEAVRLVRASGDGSALVAIHPSNSIVRVTDEGQSTHVFGIFEHVVDLQPDHDGRRVLLVIAEAPGARELWLLEEYAMPLRIDLPAGVSPRDGTLAWLADSDEALFADDQGQVHRVDVSTLDVTLEPGSAIAVGPVVAPAGGDWVAVDEASHRVERRHALGEVTLLLDDGRAPLAIAWSPDASRIALLFAHSIEFRDAVLGELLFRIELPGEPGSGARLQWSHWRYLLLTSEDPLRAAHLLTLPGSFCSDPIEALPGENLIEAVAENDSGLLSLPSDPIRLDVAPSSTSLADLQVAERIHLFPASVLPGDRVTALVTVSNFESPAELIDAPLLGATLRLPDGSEQELSAGTGVDVAPFSSEELLLDLGDLDLPGTYRLFVVADPSDAVPETDEGNNTATIEWRVEEELQPQISLSTDAILYAPGATIEGEAEVFNPAGTLDGWLLLELVDAHGGAVQTIGEFTVVALAAGQRRSWSWSAIVPEDLSAGEYAIRARLRDDGDVQRAVRSARVDIDAIADIELVLQPQRAVGTFGEPLPVRIGFDYLRGNRIFDGAVLRLTTDVGMETRVLWQGPIGPMLPGYSARRTVSWLPGMQQAGVSELRLTLETEGLQRIVAQSVELRSPTSASALRGSLTVAPTPRILLGVPAVLEVAVDNPGASEVAFDYRVRILAEDAATAAVDLQWPAALAAGSQLEREIALDALPQRPAAYVARLEARLTTQGADAWQLLSTIGVHAADGVAPEITVLAPASTRPQRSPTALAARILDRHGRVGAVHYRVDGGAWRALVAGGAGGHEALLHGLVDGPHAVEVRATDDSMNESVSEPASFVVDSIAPRIDIEGVSDGSISNSPAPPVIVITDAHPEGYRAWIDGTVWEGTPIEEGAHQLLVISIDAAGNRAERNLEFTVDLTAPGLAFTAPAQGSSTRQRSVDVRVATEPGARVRLLRGDTPLDRIADGEGVVSFAAVPLAVGSNVLEAVATDRAGNASDPVSLMLTREPLSGMLVGDIQPETTQLPRGQALPVTLRLDNGTETDLSALEVRLAASAPDGTLLHEAAFEIAIGSGTEQTIDATLPAASWPWGPVTLVVRADSGDGPRTLDSISIEVLDRQAPQIDSIQPGAGSIQPRPTILRAAASDDHAIESVEYRLDGSDWTSMAFDAGNYGASILADDSTHVVRFRATDTAGNSDESADVGFTVDGTPPTISFEDVLEGGRYRDSVSPRVHVEEANPDRVELTLDGQTFVDGTPVTAEGVHRLSAAALDLAGNSGSAQVEFTIDRTPPPLRFIEPAENSVIAGDRVLVIGETDANTIVVLTIGEFAAKVAANAAGRFSVPDVPLEPGLNLVTAHAIDDVGNQSATTSLRLHRSNAGPSGLEGLLTAPATVARGSDMTVVLDLLERVDLARTGVPVTLRLRRAGGSDVLSQRDFSVDLPASGSWRQTELVSTDTFMLGTHVATLSARVSAIDHELASITFDVVDAEAPVVQLVTPADEAWHRDHVPVRATVVDESPLLTVEARVDSGPWLAMHPDGSEWALQLVPAREGRQAIDVRARDVHDNVGGHSGHVRIDRTHPSVRVDGVEDGAVAQGPLHPTIVVEDASPVTMSATLDGLPFVSGTSVSSEGEHRLIVTAVDAVGLETALELGFSIDSTGPSLSVSHPTAGSTISATQIDVLGTTEPNALVRLLVPVTREVQANGSGAFVIPAVPLATGSNLLQLRAIDASGNAGAIVEVSVQRACGSIDFGCALFADGFEGEGPTQKGGTQGVVPMSAPTPIPSRHPLLLLLFAGALLATARRAISTRGDVR